MPPLTDLAQSGSALGTLLMMIVWVVYLSLAYREYKEQRRPWFILHEEGDGDESTRCLLVNMSPLTAHLTMVFAVVNTGDRTMARRLRSQGASGGTSDEAGVPPYREGPMAPGSVMSLGTFGELFDDLVTETTGDGDYGYDQVDSVEIRVVAASPAQERGPLGALRRFEMSSRGQVKVRPLDVSTTQLRSRRERTQVARWMEQGWEHARGTGTWKIDELEATDRRNVGANPEQS